MNFIQNANLYTMNEKTSVLVEEGFPKTTITLLHSGGELTMGWGVSEPSLPLTPSSRVLNIFQDQNHDFPQTIV